MEGKAWLQRTVKILESMACPEEHCVWLATFLLEGDADQWWKAIHRLKFSDIKWRDFEVAFYEKYFPDHERIGSSGF